MKNRGKLVDNRPPTAEEKPPFAESTRGECWKSSRSNDGFYANMFKSSTVLVSFETAAALIEEERRRDDSDFIEGWRRPGAIAAHTAFGSFLGINRKSSRGRPLCGIDSILDRGLEVSFNG